MAGVIMIWPHGIEITLYGTCRDNQRKLLASLNLSIYIAFMLFMRTPWYCGILVHGSEFSHITWTLIPKFDR